MLELHEIIPYLPYELKFYDLLDKEVVSVYSLHPAKDTFDSPTFWMKYPREADEPIFHRRVLDWRAYKPLLLPPSEMSDELKEQLDKVFCGCIGATTLEALDLYHANMIDYRNLIGRGDAKNVREYE